MEKKNITLKSLPSQNKGFFVIFSRMRHLFEMWRLMRDFYEIQGQIVVPEGKDLIDIIDKNLMDKRTLVPRYELALKLGLRYSGDLEDKSERGKSLYREKMVRKTKTIQNLISDCVDSEFGFLEEKDNCLCITGKGSKFRTITNFGIYLIKETWYYWVAFGAVWTFLTSQEFLPNLSEIFNKILLFLVHN